MSEMANDKRIPRQIGIMSERCGNGHLSELHLLHTVVPLVRYERNGSMKSLLLAACLALGAGSFALVAPAQARVDISLPGVHIDAGHRHHYGEWRRHEEWRHDHCWNCGWR
jgi:hypothetical protein